MDLGDTGSDLRRTTTRPGRTRTTIHAIESPYGFVGLPQARAPANEVRSSYKVFSMRGKLGQTHALGETYCEYQR